MLTVSPNKVAKLKLPVINSKKDIVPGQMYILLSGIQAPKLIVEVNSFEEASAIHSAYIGVFDLGGSTTTGGDLLGLEYDAYVSYNGRVWKGKHTGATNQEIEIDKANIGKLVEVYSNLIEERFF